ncbi:hypothetical protein RJ55_02064 [Drechmeria coniospora]|nr:hypothetical protein RJ55_02064 [Drechmeria coniospora]
MPSAKLLITCLVAGSQYLIHPRKLASIQETINPDAILPVTLLDTQEIYGDLEATLRLFDAVDDVFIPEFGFVVVEKPGPNSSAVSGQRHLALLGKQLYQLAWDEVDVVASSELGHLPSGPYIPHGPNLHQSWKLYEDEFDAFSVGVILENVTRVGDFRALSSLSASGAHRFIPVPSLLYSLFASVEKPLSGMRVSIPDSSALQGVQTSISSRAWHSLHSGPAAVTSTLGRRLMDLGAIAVGKTKSSQFGDGSDSSGGAAGAGAGAAGYGWLRAAFGFDELGGLGETATSHGVLSLRMTPGLLPLEGSQVNSQNLVSAGVLGRDVLELSNIVSASVNRSAWEDIPLPRRLVYPVDLFDPPSSEQRRDLLSAFVKMLENSLGIKAETFNISARWTESRPAEARGQSLQAYMQVAPFRAYCYEFYHAYDEFRDRYEAEFGHGPYLEATVQHRWKIGETVTEQEYREYGQRIGVFRKWFNIHVMNVTAGAPQAAMILPFDRDGPSYKDEKPRAPASPQGVTAELLSAVLQTPQMMAPCTCSPADGWVMMWLTGKVAQLPYKSRVSGRKEYHAVHGSIMGIQGGGPTVISTVQKALESALWRSRVDVGRLAFPVGNNSRNVDDRFVGQADEHREGPPEVWGEL